MKFESTNLGAVEANPEKEIVFPNGIIGLEDCKRFNLYHENKDNPLVFWLQSIEHPDITFSVVDPSIMGINYDITLDDDEVKLLEMEKPDDLVVLMIVRKTNKELETDDQDGQVKANAIAPLIINTATRRGLQKCTVVCELLFKTAKES